MTDEDELRQWEQRVRDGLIPKLRDSAIVVSIVPEGDLDPKYCVELGASIMLDKPIIAAVRPGTRVPLKLAKIADHIIECNMSTEAGRQQFTDALAEVIRELKP